MGLEEVVPRAAAVDFPALLAALAAAGSPALVAMIDGALQAPGAAVPPGWRDVRLRFTGGTVTLARRPGGVAVVVFGNADAALIALQDLVKRTLVALP